MPPSPRYQLGEEIGRGALGRVVHVLDTETGTQLAGKLLHESNRGDAAARERFAVEAEILHDLVHPNLVRIYGLEEIDGAEVLLMEHIAGRSLAATIAHDAPLPEARIVALARGIASGLAAAHHAGLMHRDLKPANILVASLPETTSEVAKIVDFGMARATSFESIDPSAFVVVGTPDYMAPESVEPLAVDSRTDIYALGCIMFEMATGRPPYNAPTAFALLERHRDAPIPAIEPRRELSRSLLELIAWCLAKSPADRPQSAALIEEVLGRSGGPERAWGLVPPQAEAGALMRPGQGARAGGGCASCGRPLIADVAVCFTCGLEQPKLEPGGSSVFVVGPGELASKLDAFLRQALLDWLLANPALGLDPVELAKKVPRLPFVVATGISASSAARLVSSLERLGFVCTTREGGRFSEPLIRRKAWHLAGRIALIAVGSFAALGRVAMVAIPAVAVIATGAAWALAGRRIATQKISPTSLPAILTERLARIATVVPTIAETRHRENLRGVVARVLSLRGQLDAHTGSGADGEPSRASAGGQAALPAASFDEEFAQILDLAMVASARGDELEASLAGADLREPSDELRALLRKRDHWAARLLETTAFLDSLRARSVALTTEANTHEGMKDDAELLEALQHQVEALREVRER